MWIKPPGESDGASQEIPNDEGKGFDRMCDPTYTGNARNGNSMSGALPNAPISGAWFSAQFQHNRGAIIAGIMGFVTMAVFSATFFLLIEIAHNTRRTVAFFQHLLERGNGGEQ